jgi:hypothetical protein
MMKCLLIKMTNISELLKAGQRKLRPIKRGERSRWRPIKNVNHNLVPKQKKTRW